MDTNSDMGRLRPPWADFMTAAALATVTSVLIASWYTYAHDNNIAYTGPIWNDRANAPLVIPNLSILTRMPGRAPSAQPPPWTLSAVSRHAAHVLTLTAANQQPRANITTVADLAAAAAAPGPARAPITFTQALEDDTTSSDLRRFMDQPVQQQATQQGPVAAQAAPAPNPQPQAAAQVTTPPPTRRRRVQPITPNTGAPAGAAPPAAVMALNTGAYGGEQQQQDQQEPTGVAPRRQTAATEMREMDISVTVAIRRGDMTHAMYTTLCEWAQRTCIKAFLAMERGGRANHLHIQGALRVRTTSTLVLSRAIREALGWDTAAPEGANVLCKEASGRGMHTLLGLCGYSSKDSGKAHYEEYIHNITPEELQQGRELYAEHAPDYEREKTAINKNNLFRLANIFFNQRRFDVTLRDRYIASPEDILLDMMRSGRYYPSAAWVIPGPGMGMRREKMHSMWRMLLRPEDTTREDVDNVFVYDEEDAGGRAGPAERRN